MDCRQISVLTLNEFNQINWFLTLNHEVLWCFHHKFSSDVNRNKSKIIRLDSLNIKTEIKRQSL